MPLSFTCPHCSTAFAVSEEDRGFSAYCVSCGKECDIPADLGDHESPVETEVVGRTSKSTRDPRTADLEVRPTTTPSTDNNGDSPQTSIEDEAPVTIDPRERISRLSFNDQSQQSSVAVQDPPRTKRASVFSSAGATKVLTKSVGELDCLCGAKIPVTVEDVGTTVYCQACGAGLPVGDQLSKIAVAEAAPAAETATNVAVSAPKFRWIGSKPALAVMVLLLGGIAFVVYAAWKDPMLLPEGMRTLIRAEPRVAVAPNAGEDDGEIDPGEPITLESIRRLLKRRNARMALVRAQIWDSELKTQGVPEDEERRTELKRVMALLIERLTPKEKPTPEHVIAFRKMLDDLGKALTNKDVESAEKLYREASQLFRKHPAELAADSGRLFQYQAWLRKLQLLTHGVRDAKRRLDQAAEVARQGRPTEALEMQAKAMFGARRIPAIKYEEEKKLVEFTRKTVMPLIAWSRGKRAVADAAECQKLGDRVARDRQLEYALDNLPPIGSKLPGVEDTRSSELNVRTRRLAKMRIGNSRRTALGYELDVRAKFEIALEHMGRGKTEEFTAAAAKAKSAFDALTGQTRLYKPLSQMIGRLPGYAFEMISQELEVLGELPISSRADRIPPIRRSLESLAPWKGDNRYAALQAALNNLSKELVEDRLKTAKAFEKAGQLDKAVEAARQLEQAGDQQTAAAARKLREGWEAEIKLRASKKAQADLLAKIAGLIDTDKPLEASRQIALFETRYPKEKSGEKLGDLKTKLQPKLVPAAEDLLKTAEKQQRDEEWPAFRKTLKQLEDVQLTIQQGARHRLLLGALQKLQTRIDGHMQEVRRAERMATTQEIVTVRDRTEDILALDPDHSEAKKLNAKAKKLLETTLSKMLSDAETLIGYIRRGRRGLKGRTLILLREISKMDPRGEYGRKARRYRRTVRRLR